MVLGFEPIYALVASRQPAGATRNSFMIDNYRYLLYKNVGVDESWIPPLSNPNILDVMGGRRGQEQISSIAQHADYVIIDDRARNQLTQDSMRQILLGRSQIFQSGPVSVYGSIFSKP